MAVPQIKSTVSPFVLQVSNSGTTHHQLEIYYSPMDFWGNLMLVVPGPLSHPPVLPRAWCAEM